MGIFSRAAVILSAGGKLVDHERQERGNTSQATRDVDRRFRAGTTGKCRNLYSEAISTRDEVRPATTPELQLTALPLFWGIGKATHPYEKITLVIVILPHAGRRCD